MEIDLMGTESHVSISLFTLKLCYYSEAFMEIKFLTHVRSLANLYAYFRHAELTSKRKRH